MRAQAEFLTPKGNQWYLLTAPSPAPSKPLVPLGNKWRWVFNMVIRPRSSLLMAIKCITNPLLILFRERKKSWLRLPTGRPLEPTHPGTCPAQFVHRWRMSRASSQGCSRGLTVHGAQLMPFPSSSRIRTTKRQDHRPGTAS